MGQVSVKKVADICPIQMCVASVMSHQATECAACVFDDINKRKRLETCRVTILNILTRRFALFERH